MLKGFTHITGLSNGKKTHIIATHTQAQYKPYQIVATLTQLAYLGHYVSELPKDERVLLMGDLNIPREHGEFKLLKYLLSLDDQPTPEGQRSFDAKENPLVKGNERLTLDYILTRGYEIGAVEIENNAYTKKISDHFPLRTIETPRNEETIPWEALSVEQQQDRILEQLIRLAYKQLAEKGWQTIEGQRIHFVVLGLIKDIESLGEARVLLGSEDKFLRYCLGYRYLGSELGLNLYFSPPSESVLHYTLKDLIDYKMKPENELERFLIAFKQQIFQLYDANTFPMTGVKQLRKLFLEQDEFYDYAGNANKAKIIALLKKSQEIISKRLVAKSPNREPAIQLFYTSAANTLAVLFQNMDPKIETFSTIEENAELLNINTLTELQFFQDLGRNISTLKKWINSDEWNAKGHGFFGNKTPDGIKQLRGLLKNFLYKEEADYSNVEKVSIIKLFMEIHQLTGRKKVSHSWGRREESVRDLYEQAHDFFDLAYKEFNADQQSMFDFVYLNRAESATRLYACSSRFFVDIFDEAPCLTKELVGEFKSCSRADDTLAERLPNSPCYTGL